MAKRTFNTSIRANVPRVEKILLPARLNVMGGWLDQLLWNGDSAVINMAVGWRSPKCFDGVYPMMISRKGFESAITGVGTGLGISSIKASGEFLLDNPYGDYVGCALEWEWDEGTRGGWQDQTGAIQPGCKLITTDDHINFEIENYDDHPVIERLVIFDSGIRRRAETIGSRVRDLFEERQFRAFMRRLADDTKRAFRYNADEFSLACLDAWNTFLSFVPEMNVELPLDDDLTFGKMMAGAGGGGYGIIFCKSVEARQPVIAKLTEQGVWATTPVLLDGAKFVWES